VILSACHTAKPVIESQKKEVTEAKTELKEEIKTIATTAKPEATETKIDTVKVITTPIAIEEVKKPDTEIVVETKTITEAFNHDVWHRLLQNHVSNEGNVNYKGIKKEATRLRAYIKSLGENKPNENWTKADKLAYWINAYNALTVDLIIRNYPINSIKDIKDPWDERLWKLGNKWYNLNEIEHQILRKMDEPRIHFAIVCASFSCPKLVNSAFTASQIELQLTKATTEFLSDSKRNSITENNIAISKIFKWFAKDFKQNGSLIDFLNRYSETPISSEAKKSFKDYNWSLNE
jgi:hypothetical protein